MVSGVGGTNNNNALANAVNQATASSSQFVSENTFFNPSDDATAKSRPDESTGPQSVCVPVGFIFIVGADDGDEHEYAERFGQFGD